MIRKKIVLREERDFGEKFNAVFTFVQSNFKPFIKVIGLTVGPLAIIGGLFFGLFFTKMTSVMTTAFAGNSLDSASWVAEMAMSYFFLGLASLWMMLAVYSFMAEYDKGVENITIEVVWNRAKGKIWPAIGFGFLIILALSIFAMIIFTLPGSTGFGLVLKLLLFYITVFYITISLSLVIPNMVIDDAGLFESIVRSFTLINGKWWSTFGLLMVMGIIANVATLIFAVPFYTVWIVTLLTQISFGEVLTMIGSCILFLGTFLMMTLPAMAIGFQYFNLVERKEGTGLLNKIDQLGKPVQTTNEGEY